MITDKKTRDGILRQIHGITHREEVCSCENRTALNAEPLFLRIERTNYVDSAICPKCPEKCWRGTSYQLHLEESSPMVVQRPSGMMTSPTLLSPSWCEGIRPI